MRKEKNSKITDKEEKFIREHTDWTTTEVAQALGVSVQKIYYFTKKNGIKLKPTRNTVKEYLSKLV
mgnify:CR=1 FL=1